MLAWTKHVSKHSAKFHSDWPRNLGDLALKKEKEEE